MSLILSGYKIISNAQAFATKILEHIRIGKEKYPDLIAGFDLINEEDYSPSLEDFMPSVLGAQQDDQSALYKMPTYFHAGETHDREITNMHDAVLLNSRRLGHGFQLTLFPNLLQEIKKRDICIESCPLSNMVLGYCKDMRTHPVRFLLHHGVQVSISSDDPGFFNYAGVTLDFVYVALGWELDLMDLKKLCINGLQYSSIPQEQKDNLLNNVFPEKWNAFITELNALEVESNDFER